MLDNRINTFLDLCQTMNFTRTADNLFITQPAVTQHIHFLEKEYGTKLFSFSGKVLTLTEEGKLLYRYALSARSNSKKLQKSIADLKDNKPSISFGATKTIGEFIMPSFLSSYLKDIPEVDIHLEVDNTRRLIQRLDDGKLDFALIEGFFDTASYEYQPFATVDFICACGNESKLTGKQCGFTDLLAEKLILREQGSGTRELTEMILKENSLDIQSFSKKIQISSFSVIQKLLCESLGIAFVYEPVMKNLLSSGEVKKVSLKGFFRCHNFNIVYLPNKNFENHIISFFDKLIELHSA